MYIKTQRIKLANLRHAVLHRCEKDKDEQKEIMHKIKKEMKTVGFWKNKDKYATEIIISKKLPRNARPELIQKTHQKLHNIIESELSELKKKYKVITQYFYHVKETIDGELNVHIHCLIITIDQNNQVLSPTKKGLFQLAKFLIQKYDPAAFQKLENALKKKQKSGKKVIYDTSRAPLWYCQKLKKAILKHKQKEKQKYQPQITFKELLLETLRKIETKTRHQKIHSPPKTGTIRPDLTPKKKPKAIRIAPTL